MTAHTTPRPPALPILIINPNTSTQMTQALEPAIRSLFYHAQNVQFSYFTCPPPGIPSINSPDDAAESARACLPHLIPLVSRYEAFLVACYSAHPLVGLLRAECEKLNSSGDVVRRYVTGIFDASVAASLSLVNAHPHRYGHASPAGFGIVSTGKVWETALADAVREFLGGGSSRFLGCETTGLNASELHDMPVKEVRKRMMDATARVVRSGKEKGVVLRAVCLGCAGMVGLEEAVREALVREMGEDGNRVAVVDGVKAGVGELVMLARGGF